MRPGPRRRGALQIRVYRFTERPGQTGGKRVPRCVKSSRPAKPCDGTRMEIKVQIVVRSEAGESEVLEVARLERSALRVDTLGLSLAEARCLLAELQQAMAERQAAHGPGRPPAPGTPLQQPSTPPLGPATRQDQPQSRPDRRPEPPRLDKTQGGLQPLPPLHFE
jgi:hypothetical protein